MTAGTFAPADGEPDDPENQQHDRSDPQEMDCETGTEQNKDKQKRENEQHERTQPF